MTEVQIRTEVHKMVDRLDETLLAAIHSMLQTYEQKKEDDPIVGYDLNGLPLRASLLKEELLQELEGVEKGHFITIEDLEKKSEQWLTATR
ncbi:hypothetical protein [Haliscomenobacter hydrossis]|uniref:Uncharacterized protein n=1 Tax=Haliscomenobacter hydrossis (strain ATCC 27775 / DSM 1100 / LMG 10767 / O) TaxID=760192 RepID=F4L0V3_HALH1|nr:hypothetical protein [Haliscomenobacter hydrossis]AEE50557.1 hypothetical protein Halhy_2689 [Haliscomenobacter hydrossis DSM 1100]